MDDANHFSHLDALMEKHLYPNALLIEYSLVFSLHQELLLSALFPQCYVLAQLPQEICQFSDSPRPHH